MYPFFRPWLYRIDYFENNRQNLSCYLQSVSTPENAYLVGFLLNICENNKQKSNYFWKYQSVDDKEQYSQQFP